MPPAAGADDLRRWRSLLRWPPRIEDVSRHGHLALACVALPSLALVLLTASRREEAHVPAAAGSAEGGDGTERWRKEEMARRLPRLAQLAQLVDENLSDGTACHVTFKELFDACVGVYGLDARQAALGQGFFLAAALLLDELRETTRKTKEGVGKYKTGEDVAVLLNHYKVLYSMCRGLTLGAEERRRLWSKVRELRRQSWVSLFALWALRLPDLAKACSVVVLGRGYLPWILASSVIKVAAQCMGSVQSLYRAQAIETLRTPGFTTRDTIRDIRANVFVTLVRSLLTLVGDRLHLMGMLGLHHKLRTEVYSAMLRQDVEWYRLGQQDQRNVGRIFEQIFALPHLANSFVNFFVHILETGASLAATGSIIRQRSTGFMTTMVCFELAQHAGKIAIEATRRWSDAVLQRQKTKVDTNWIEPLQPENITTVRSCAAEARVLENWNMFWRAEHDAISWADFVKLGFKPLDLACGEGAWAMEVFTASHLVRTGQIPNVADLQSLNELAVKLGFTIWETATQAMSIRETTQKLARAYEIISIEPSIGLEGGLVPPMARIRGEIEFRGVSFKYPGTDTVLKSLSFTVRSEELCGITGSSGSGKSTLFCLLQRLYDPSEGQILVDGMDIRSLNPTWLRRQMAVVSQRPRIFHTTLLSNLVYGCASDLSVEVVEDACRAACIHDLIFQNRLRFPMGLHTRVSNETLSGGELQRVAIARAILADAPILLLDEATSALDSESQSLVKQGLRNLMRGKTVVTVAHRLETIKDAASIICIEAGELREQGTHKELVQAGGLYSRLYREQIESTVAEGGSPTG